METMKLTQSRRSAFRKCRRLHHIEYDLGIEPVRKADALRCGTLYHKGVEEFWHLVKKDPVSDLQLLSHAAAELMIAAVPNDQVDDVVADAYLLVQRYYRLWPDAREYDVVAVEVEHDAPLMNPDTGMTSKNWTLHGTVDLLLQDRSTGEVFLVEHKTTSDDVSPEAPYWQKLAMDTQLTQYIMLAESLSGKEVSRVIYDVARKPATQLLRATPPEKRKYRKDGGLYDSQRENDETVQEYIVRVAAKMDEEESKYFGRRVVARTAQQIYDGLADAWQDAKMIREAQNNGWHTRNPEACHQFGTCAYWDHCAMGVDLHTSTLWRKREDRSHG